MLCKKCNTNTVEYDPQATTNICTICGTEYGFCPVCGALTEQLSISGCESCKG